MQSATAQLISLQTLKPQPAPFGYGHRRAFLQLALALLLVPACQALAAVKDAPTLKIIAFGDSLVAGHGLAADAAFPSVLQAKLRAEGYNVTIVNAGVSGDTTSGGLARLDWTLGDGADGVILELGANDMLRGVDPDVTKAALDAMLAKLKARNIKVLIAGMKATPSLGPEFKSRFDAIYPELAKKYEAPLYPFFLDGVAGDSSFELPDGLHPNPAGVERIVARILPAVRAFLNHSGENAAAKPRE
jgi:acyl-CoA thioesterase I